MLIGVAQQGHLQYLGALRTLGLKEIVGEMGEMGEIGSLSEAQITLHAFPHAQPCQLISSRRA